METSRTRPRARNEAKPLPFGLSMPRCWYCSHCKIGPNRGLLTSWLGVQPRAFTSRRNCVDMFIQYTDIAEAPPYKDSDSIHMSNPRTEHEYGGNTNVWTRRSPTELGPEQATIATCTIELGTFEKNNCRRERQGWTPCITASRFFFCSSLSFLLRILPIT